MILVTFAVPFESKAFRDKLPADAKIECLHTGVGCAAASEAIQRALRQQSYSHVIISGFAGGLVEHLAVGDLISTDDGARLGNAVMIGGLKTVKISQSHQVLTNADTKARFQLETGAEAVDMETRTIRDACHQASIPYSVIRVISDDAQASLVVPADLLTNVTRRPIRGGLKLFAFLAVRPTTWGPFLEMVRNCRVAQRRLANALMRAVDQMTPSPPPAP